MHGNGENEIANKILDEHFGCVWYAHRSVDLIHQHTIKYNTTNKTWLGIMQLPFCILSKINNYICKMHWRWMWLINMTPIYKYTNGMWLDIMDIKMCAENIIIVLASMAGNDDNNVVDKKLDGYFDCGVFNLNILIRCVYQKLIQIKITNKIRII